MDPTQFAALDKLIDAQDGGLTGSATTGKRKGSDQILSDLEQQGWIEKRGKKYVRTPAGRTAWEQHAPADRRAAIEQRAEEAKAHRRLELLRAIAKKNGKAFTPTEARKLDTDLCRELCDQQFIKNVGDNKFVLLPNGKAILLAEEPIATQIERVQSAFQQTHLLCDAARQRLERDLAGLPNVPSMNELVAGLRGKMDAATTAFESAITELCLTAGLAHATHQLKDAILTARSEVEQSLERAQQGEQEIRDTASKIQGQMDDFRHEFASRIAALSNPTPTPATVVAPTTHSDQAVWDATLAAHSRLREQTLRLGGIVKVPELSDAVASAVPNLTPQEFRTLLTKWHGEGRLVLQVCNDRPLEPRAAEGIESPRGLLFYVHMSAN